MALGCGGRGGAHLWLAPGEAGPGCVVCPAKGLYQYAELIEGLMFSH